MYCKKCGNKIENGNKCISCGYVVNSEYNKNNKKFVLICSIIILFLTASIFILLKSNLSGEDIAIDSSNNSLDKKDTSKYNPDELKEKVKNAMNNIKWKKDIIIYNFSEGMAILMYFTEGVYKRGYVDSKGKIIIEPKYDECKEFSEGLAAVCLGDYWGFVDKSGKEITAIKYRNAHNFSEGLAPVYLDERCGYIDKSGNTVIEHKYTFGGTFSEGLASVFVISDSGVYKSSYIDKEGKEVISLKYDNAKKVIGGRFKEGLARINIDDKYGYIDKSGKMIIEPIYDVAEEFSEGRALVAINGKFGYIDTKGKEVIPLNYDYVDDEEVYYDYDWIYRFSEGLAAVSVKGEDGKYKWKYIDKSGKDIIYTDYKKVRIFTGGLALVIGEDERCGYINKKGEEVTPVQYYNADIFSEGLAAVSVDGSSAGILDIN